MLYSQPLATRFGTDLVSHIKSGLWNKLDIAVAWVRVSGLNHLKPALEAYLKAGIAKFELDLPPLDQQRRIVEILWAIDNHNLLRKAALDSLQELHKTKLDFACSAPNDRRMLGEVVTYASDGPFGSKLKTEHYAESGARVIRLQNIGELVAQSQRDAKAMLDSFLNTMF